MSNADAAEDTDAGAGRGDEQAGESPVDWLRINARKHAAQILQTVKLRAFNPRATEWQRMFALAAAFRARHGHLDACDKSVEGDLVSWLDRQRYLKGAGLLAPVRVNELDQLDMIWDKHARSWERGFVHASAWAAIHGHLAIPAAEKLDGHGVGAWMGRQRKNSKLTVEQDAKLTALDAMWRIEPDWNRSYRRLLAYLAAVAPWTAPPTAPAATPTRPSDRVRGCASRTRPAPTGSSAPSRPRSWRRSNGTPRRLLADSPRANRILLNCGNPVSGQQSEHPEAALEHPGRPQLSDAAKFHPEQWGWSGIVPSWS
ncbi:helicase associated domain-containing protein [Kitasatospora sp. NPDC086009]|uniref:helicase associated domain-containing protein n=1 Tax=unclassified Kitasatospora TaxID=2633591 RepID=UPI0037C526E9